MSLNSLMAKRKEDYSLQDKEAFLQMREEVLNIPQTPNDYKLDVSTYDINGKAVGNHLGDNEINFIKNLISCLELINAQAQFQCDVINEYVQDRIEEQNKQLAASCSQSCGAALDEIIINGIGGIAKTQSTGSISLPLSQYICADTKQYDNPDTLAGQGLTPSKVAFAVALLREKYNSPDLICVCSNRAIGQLQSAERTASSFGIMTPFAGVQYFVASEAVPKKAKAHLVSNGSLISADSTTAKESTNGEVELAYIFAREQIVLGCSKEFGLKSAEDAHRNFDLVFQRSCIRKFCKGAKIPWRNV